MAVFRVPYPDEPERREALFRRVTGMLERHGRYEGTPTRGTFEGSTPIGSFAGSYRVVDGAGELEIELTKKPWLVSAHRVESEVRKFLTGV
jgi:hypothetical protein